MQSTFAFLLASALAASASAQMRDNRDKTMTCGDPETEHGARHCDIREQSFAAQGHLTIDGGNNGGATIKGWLRGDVLVRAKVQTWAPMDSEAAQLAGQVRVDAGAGQVGATGPESVNEAGWAVSYEIFVPQSTGLDLKTHNGGISISDVRGRIEFDTTNGGVNLKRIAGDVKGATVNGGLHIELTGNTWDGPQFEASTRNGGIMLAVPRDYSAHLQAEVVNGGIESDFPIVMGGKPRPHSLDFNLGSGGPLIHVSATNGGVRLKQL